MKKTTAYGVLMACLLAQACASPSGQTTAQSGAGVNVGVLNCNVAGGWGLIFGSSRDVQCTFDGLGGRTERYRGTISRFGADIGYSQAGVMVWSVLAPTASMAPGALRGTYQGATAGAAVVVGAGANVLVGGLNNSISLQPVSIEGRAGLNVAAGIASLTLEPTS